MKNSFSFFFQEAVRFRHINKEEEPPLRTLDHGLHGEGVRQLVAPHPYMVQSSDGVWYHGYRFDQVSSFNVTQVSKNHVQSVCEEAAHTSEGLRNIFGPKDSDTGTYFRQVPLRQPYLPGLRCLDMLLVQTQAWSQWLQSSWRSWN